MQILWQCRVDHLTNQKHGHQNIIFNMKVKSDNNKTAGNICCWQSPEQVQEDIFCWIVVRQKCNDFKNSQAWRHWSWPQAHAGTIRRVILKKSNGADFVAICVTIVPCGVYSIYFSLQCETWSVTVGSAWCASRRRWMTTTMTCKQVLSVPFLASFMMPNSGTI